MPIRRILLNSDVGPNLYTPTPAGLHYVNVDEDPHDSDSTILATSVGGAREVWGLDVIALPNNAIITNVAIRSAQKESAAGANSYHVGFIINGIDHFAATHFLGSGSTYVTAEDDFATSPATGLAWTKTELAAAQLVHEQLSQAVGLPRPRVTQCIVLARLGRQIGIHNGSRFVLFVTTGPPGAEDIYQIFLDFGTREDELVA